MEGAEYSLFKVLGSHVWGDDWSPHALLPNQITVLNDICKRETHTYAYNEYAINGRSSEPQEDGTPHLCLLRYLQPNLLPRIIWRQTCRLASRRPPCSPPWRRPSVYVNRRLASASRKPHLLPRPAPSSSLMRSVPRWRWHLRWQRDQRTRPTGSRNNLTFIVRRLQL